MAKKNTDRAKQQRATETTAKLPAASAGVSLQALTPVAASNSSQPPALQAQTGPVKAEASQASLVPAVQAPKSSGRAVVAGAPSLSEVPRVKVTFVLPPCPCGAQRVSLCGDFNGWLPDATPMELCKDGHWETTVELAPGRYEYKFVRDGEWMPDLLALENVLNPHGTLNSVIHVSAR